VYREISIQPLATPAQRTAISHTLLQEPTCDLEPFAAASRPFAVPCRSLPGPRDHTVPAAVAPVISRLSPRNTSGTRSAIAVSERLCCCSGPTVAIRSKSWEQC